MSNEYVSQVLLEGNGISITDFKSVTEKKQELYKSFKLMGKKGHCKASDDPGAIVEYVVPLDSPEFDFKALKGGTLTIDYQNGKRVKYTGVYTQEIGERKFTGEGETVCSIDLSATKRTET